MPTKKELLVEAKRFGIRGRHAMGVGMLEKEVMKKQKQEANRKPSGVKGGVGAKKGALSPAVYKQLGKKYTPKKVRDQEK